VLACANVLLFFFEHLNSEELHDAWLYFAGIFANVQNLECAMAPPCTINDFLLALF